MKFLVIHGCEAGYSVHDSYKKALEECKQYDDPEGCSIIQAEHVWEPTKCILSFKKKF